MAPNEIRLAICGLGSAGKSRLQAIPQIKGVALAGVVSRRPEAATLDWDEALGDPSIQAIAVSTENTDHPARVEAALKAGKHVLCDYPLAFAGRQARALFTLAKRKGLILHVEHIGLLTSAHRIAKEETRKLGSLKAGSYSFQAAWNAKIADRSRTGPYPFLAVSRLMQVADLFGAFRIRNPRYRESADGFSLQILLEFEQGGSLEFSEERAAGLQRGRRLKASFDMGDWEWKAEVAPEGLFARDLEWFLRRVRDGAPAYYDETLMLGIVDALEDLGRVLKIQSQSGLVTP